MCNVAVEPGLSVELTVTGSHTPMPRVRLDLAGQCAEFDLGGIGDPFVVDPLVEAALRFLPPPANLDLAITSGVPVGSGLGTSAAVAVALLAGLHGLRGSVPSPAELASEAHAVETSLGLQSGIQDQLGAAYGGTNLFEISYPGLASPVRRIDEATLARLGESLVTVYLGRPHRSSELHERVIASLEGCDNESLLAPLRAAAQEGFNALRSGDIDAYASAMRANHEGQRRLHPDLICPLAEATIRAAAACGARGWKVNGAGGDGGSLCVVGPEDPGARGLMIEAIESNDRVRVLDLRVTNNGVQVTTRT